MQIDFGSILIILSILSPTLILIYRFPHISILAPIFGTMFSLPISIWFGNLSLTTLSLQLIGVCSSILLFTRAKTKNLTSQISKSLLILIFVCFMGFIIGVQSVERIVQLQAIKILILPIILSIGSINPKFNWKLSLKILIAILGVQNVVAIIEYKLGVYYLMSIGLQYGKELRHINGQLRPPALFMNHFEYGLFSAAIFVACITYMEYSSSQADKWIKFGISISLLGVLLSTARTAIVIVLAAYILKNQFKTSDSFLLHGRIAKSVNATGMAILIALIFPSLSSDGSAYSRIDNWRLILSEFNIWIGSGLGIAGGATSSNFSNKERVVIVDNYFLSLLAQVGILGLILFLLCLYFLIETEFKNKFIITALLCSFLTLESWEYFASMTIFLISLFRMKISLDEKAFNETHDLKLNDS